MRPILLLQASKCEMKQIKSQDSQKQEFLERADKAVFVVWMVGNAMQAVRIGCPQCPLIPRGIYNIKSIS